MKIFRILMLLGLAWFIIVTGVFLLPQLIDVPNSKIMVWTYSVSIILGASYFTWLIFEK